MWGYPDAESEFNRLCEIIYWSPAKISEPSRAELGSSDKAKDQQKISLLQKGEIRENIFCAVNLKKTFLMYCIHPKDKTVLKYSLKDPNTCGVKRICGLSLIKCPNTF